MNGYRCGIWIYSGILHSCKNKELIPFAATWIPRDYYTKRRQKEKDKYHTISLIYEP